MHIRWPDLRHRAESRRDRRRPGVSDLGPGHKTIYKITGPMKYEIDVFDSEGRYLYILKLAEGMSLFSEQFYDF
jgi:hypothetical protein